MNYKSKGQKDVVSKEALLWPVLVYLFGTGTNQIFFVVDDNDGRYSRLTTTIVTYKWGLGVILKLRILHTPSRLISAELNGQLIAYPWSA